MKRLLVEIFYNNWYKLKTIMLKYTIKLQTMLRYYEI